MFVSSRVLAGGLALALIFAARAGASVPHTVQPGETLWSIAAANNFTTRALAAANGLSENANVVVGSTIQVPSEGEAAVALQSGGVAPSAAAGGTAAPGSGGSYRVQPGDTLSGIAARAGVTPSELASMNGLSSDSHVIAGTALYLPAASAAPSAPAPASTAPATSSAPHPTPGYVSSGQIGEIASAHGVPADLAAAVAWQESGFNNGLVSSADARGVMQILPGTWDWIQTHLAESPLDPGSPLENVHAGVMYLGNQLSNWGGDPALAAASYYQGPDSVREIGMLPETREYVDNVLAHRSRFGGP